MSTKFLGPLISEMTYYVSSGTLNSTRPFLGPPIWFDLEQQTLALQHVAVVVFVGVRHASSQGVGSRHFWDPDVSRYRFS